jgi:hypothetical protein
MSKIAHLGTVTLDTKLATSQQLNADEIIVNDEDVATMFDIKHLYSELVTRTKLDPEENYLLYNDNGKIVYANFRGITNLNSFFETSRDITKITQKEIDEWGLNDVTTMSRIFIFSTLTSFEGQLDNVTNIDQAFANSSLSRFYGIFPNLKSAVQTFVFCTFSNAHCDFRSLETLNGTFYLTRQLKTISGNFDSVRNASGGFKGSGINAYNIPLPSLESADSMFLDCSNLETFTAKIKRDDESYSKLTNGKNMFSGCKLNAESVENVLSQLQPFEDNSTHIMTMTIQAAAVPKFNEITGNSLELTTAIQQIPFKGWTIEVNVKTA